MRYESFYPFARNNRLRLPRDNRASDLPPSNVPGQATETNRFQMANAIIHSAAVLEPGQDPATKSDLPRWTPICKPQIVF